jgi:hypothetical protein
MFILCPLSGASVQRSYALNRGTNDWWAVAPLDLIRFGGRVHYVDLVSSSFVEESLQALGGIRVSIRRSLVAAGERPVAI